MQQFRTLETLSWNYFGCFVDVCLGLKFSYFMLGIAQTLKNDPKVSRKYLDLGLSFTFDHLWVFYLPQV